MKKIVLTFGLISGVLCSLLMFGTIPLSHRIGFERGMIVGYTVMIASFLLVYFGIRSYRENVGNGQITFLRGFGVGISIALITCIFYVVTWEVMYFTMMPHFMEKYTAYEIQKVQAAGGDPAVVQAKIKKLREVQERYDNPFFNAAQTFLEPFPPGLIITLLSAAVLRKKAGSAVSSDQQVSPASS